MSLDLYQQYGIPVFPCAADKRPLTRNGFKDATTDPTIIATWQAQHPDCLWGMPTGLASGIVVLDVDVKNGAPGDASLAKLQDELGKHLFSTRTHTTQSGGFHLLFIAPDNVTIRNSASKLGPGLDIRGEGGYVVVPPSEGYAVDRDLPFEEMAVFPGVLIERLASASEGPSQRSQVDRDVKLKEGGRNEGLASIAGGLRNMGLGYESIRAILHLENKRLCKPALPDAEVDLIAHSYATYESGLKVADQFDAWDSIPEPQEWQELMLHKFKPVNEAVKGLLLEGVTLLVAKPKVGKSFLALGLAHAVATGEPALGCYETVPGDVLYFNIDDRSPRRLNNRGQKISPEFNVPRLKVYHEAPDLENGFKHYVEKWLRSADDPRLIVVDALVNIVGPKPKNLTQYQHDYNGVKYLQEVAEEYRCTVLVVHHARKTAGDTGDSYSGTTGLYGGVSGQIELKRVKSPIDDVSVGERQNNDLEGAIETLRGGTCLMDIEHRDLMESYSLSLSRDAETGMWRSEGLASTARASRESAAVWAAIKLNENGMTAREISETLGKSLAASRKICQRMHQSGQLRCETVNGVNTYFNGYAPVS